MAPFDPYHKWLGIPPQEQPAHHYRLLAITDFEVDRDVISAAAEQRTIYLRMLQAGEHELLVAQLLNEVSQARVTLLNADQKAEYDEELRKQQTPEPVPEPTPPPIPVVQTPAPTPVVVRGTVTQEFPVSVVQPAISPRKRKPKEIWKRPVVIGVSVVGVIGVFVLFISLMFSGDVNPVDNNTPPVVSVPLIPRPGLVPAQTTPNALPPSLQEGLVAYYPFNGNAQDESGNGHHGEVHGPTLIRDRHGDLNLAYEFSGENYITVGDHAILDLGSETERGLTISLWFYGNSTTDKCVNGIFVSKMTGKGKIASVMVDYALNLEVEDGRGLIWGTGPSDGFGGSNVTSWMFSGVTPSSKTWQHLLVSYQSSAENKLKRIFLDGALIKEAGIGTKNTANNGPVKIGPWNGQLDDIRIYNRALSAAEVKVLYEYESKPPASPIPPAPAIESITNSIGMTLNKIPAGTFIMGSPEDEPERSDIEHQHRVTITKAFYIQTTEVTQEQWKSVMGTEPWKGQGSVKEGPNYPATFVSWNDAVAYCKKLSEKESKTYRLPTEAEWEYACRAGTETRWSFGNDEKALGDYAWYRENADDIDEKYAHQVELKKPNAFGLYDMHGNVWEWCHDYYGKDYYKQSPEKDPTGPGSGSSRVLRGGSWSSHRSRDSRSAFRHRHDADYRNRSHGFRLVRELD
jgi:sulfatase modifying factor 1